MKKILLTCCLIFAASSFTFAQIAPVGPTKPDFMNKVNQLMMYISQNNTVAAASTWDEVQNMITAEFDYVKYRLGTAVDNNDAVEQQNMSSLTDQQWFIYEPIIPLRDDLVANQAQLMMKLNDFGNTLL